MQPPAPALRRPVRVAAEPEGPRPGAVIGAAMALAVSVGLVAWFVTSEGGRSREDFAAVRQNAPAPAATAQGPSPDPSAEQVEQAWRKVKDVYADAGAPGLVSFSRTCAEALDEDGRILDYCLAFDMYAAAVHGQGPGPEGAWFAAGEARRLRMAASALGPGIDPNARLAQVRTMMRMVSLGPAVAEPADVQPVPVTREKPPPPRRVTAPFPPASGAKPQQMRSEEVAPRSTSDCRFEPTPAARRACDNPALEQAQARMRRAYAYALAASVDPEQLDREQAAWRTAWNAASDAETARALYERRTRELEKIAPPF